MQRRDFFRSLAGAPLIARPERKNNRSHHQGERIYHGPMKIPEQILDIASRAPAYRTTCRKPCIRLALDGMTYLFRTGLCGDSYIGEIIRTDKGLRVHVWTAIPDAPLLGDILARKGVAA